MSYRMLSVSSMYPGFLDAFYNDNPDLIPADYEANYKALMADSTEFAASYSRTLSRLGMSVHTIISNDDILQKKWGAEHLIKAKGKEKIIIQQIKYYQPKILWIEDFRFIDIDTLSALKERVSSIKLIIGYHCAPISASTLRKLQKTDMTITCTPGIKKQLEDSGVNAYLVYHGFDTDLSDKNVNEPIVPSSPVVFTGSLYQGEGYHNDRIDLIEYLIGRGIKIDLFGNIESGCRIGVKKGLNLIYRALKKLKIGQPKRYCSALKWGRSPVRQYPQPIIESVRRPVFGAELYSMIRNTQIVLNSHAEVAGDYAGNMRLFEVTGNGSCLLTDNKLNMADLFEPGKEVVVYNDGEDCANKIKWLLENETERIKIARAGQQRTLKDHTVEIRCRIIMEIIRREMGIREQAKRDKN